MCFKLLVYYHVQCILLNKVLEMVLLSLNVVFQFNLNVKFDSLIQYLWKASPTHIQGLNNKNLNVNECFGYRQFKLPCVNITTKCVLIHFGFH
jgi:hypothetical protein